MIHAYRSITDFESANELEPFGRATADLDTENEALRAELDQHQPVMSAAVLTATAFRLRDRQALTGALRLLVRAVRNLEQRGAAT